MRNRLHAFLNKTYTPSLVIFKLLYPFIKKRIKKRLLKEKVDILISVIPWFNDYFLDIAQELGIPFLLMPTDLEASHFFNNINTLRF